MSGSVLVTGGTGLIGRAVVERLKGESALHVLGRSAPAAGTQWLKADLREPIDESLLPSSASAVIHLAQSEHFRDFPARAQHIFDVNIARLQQLLDWARRSGVRRFVLASSGGIYGHGDSSFREDDVAAAGDELGYYLASKHCTELLGRSYAGCFDVVILRFFFVYGPGQKRDMLIPRLVDAVSAGRPIVLQGQDGLRLNPTHVSDAAAAVCAALALQGSHVVNIAGDEIVTLRQLGAAIGAALGREPRFEVRGDEAPRHLVGDTQRMRALLGAPRSRLAEGLRTLLPAGA